VHFTAERLLRRQLASLSRNIPPPQKNEENDHQKTNKLKIQNQTIMKEQQQLSLGIVF